MHFIHEISWFKCFLHKTSAVFQKFKFSRISVDRVYSSIDWKCLKFLSLVLPGLIDPQLVLNQSNLFFRLIEPNFRLIKNFKIFEEYLLLRLISTWSVLDRLSFERRLLKKGFSLMCSSYFQNLFLSFSPLSSSTDPI